MQKSVCLKFSFFRLEFVVYQLQTYLLVAVFCFLSFFSFSQNKATIFGTVKDEMQKPVEGVNVSIINSKTGSVTDSKGKFELEVPAETPFTLVFSFIGYETKKNTLLLKTGEQLEIKNIYLNKSSIEIPEISVEEQKVHQQQGMQKIDPKNVTTIPNPSGGVEALIKTLPGVSSNNELSSQYSVRGGNYDENLVYVNDFEIYRPFLIRSGQQEGLSFINSDLTQNILFSSGGFESKYGDKMSSVLDIQYKKPKDFGGSVTASLLGGGIHLEGSNKNYRLRYLLGARYKSNDYLLSSLDKQGIYKPSFADYQIDISYELTDKLQLEILSNYSRNQYQFIPDSQVTTLGVVNSALQFVSYFEGQEIDKFETVMGGASLAHQVNKNLKLKWLTSGYLAKENETFDILGQYFLYELETDFSKETFGQRKYALGWGGDLNWARNYLTARVGNIGHKGFLSCQKHFFQWGINFQHELITDKLSEWTLLDSAGYSLPQKDTFPSFKPDLELWEVLKTKIDIQSNRYSGYFQDTWDLSDSKKIILTGGARLNYWDLNKEFIITPRLQLAVKPKWEKDIVFRASSGMYFQPPFYKELRNLNGVVNKNLKSQKSIHFVLGSDYHFSKWKRPFKFTSEIYYKYLYDLVPYEIDNVRIRYFGENNAMGYAAGIDLRLHGEIVPDEESWISLSVMQTQEDIKGDSAGFIPRPTDQRINFGMFFQDHLPKNKNFKVHLNFLFGSGLPFGPPGHDRAKDTLKMPPYRRVDIGFSALLFDKKNREAPPRSIVRHFNSIWTSLEVFNLLGVSNTVSYLWIKDITNVQWGIPNYLTARRINFKLVLNF